jgi:hypothetical protein
MTQMFQLIIAEFQHGRPVSYDGILDWLYIQHRLSVLPDTLRHMIRRIDAFKTVQGIPIESSRCQVTIEAIENHFYRLPKEIENVSTAFIFNADESGFQDFVDVREVHVIVPADFESDSVNISSQRSEKRVTMLAAVSTDGSALKPMIIIQKNLRTQSF